MRGNGGLCGLHHPFPILESLCGAGIGADKTLSFVRELLEMALVPPEAADAVATDVQSNDSGTLPMPYPISEPTPGRCGASHLAAFLAGLPSMEQEIDCKLQSNSR
jgi:hypothetical protein